MSLLLIVRKLWKYKLFTLPVFALVIAGAFYVFAVKAPTYEAGSTYILVNPPPPPTDAQIAANPALGKLNRNVAKYLATAGAGGIAVGYLGQLDQRHASTTMATPCPPPTATAATP